MLAIIELIFESGCTESSFGDVFEKKKKRIGQYLYSNNPEKPRVIQSCENNWLE